MSESYTYEFWHAAHLIFSTTARRRSLACSEFMQTLLSCHVNALIRALSYADIICLR